MLETNEMIIGIVTIAAMTFLTRVLPFVLFPENKPTPQFIIYLGKVLPFAMIGMLVVYCLKDINITVRPFAIPEIMGILIVILLHKWKRNNLISIGLGTAAYMLITHFIEKLI